MKLPFRIDLSDKVALVTGGGGVLCSEFAKALAANGAKVAVCDLREEAAQKVVDEIIAEGGKAMAVAANVLDKASLEAAREKILAEYGTVDILLNGAGHPRAAGSFPRFLRMYALETNRLSMPEAVSKVTCMAAKRFGLSKGTLSPGADADVTVFDPKTLTDHATFQEPGLAPSGIKLVLLGGQVALVDGEICKADQGYMITR